AVGDRDGAEVAEVGVVHLAGGADHGDAAHPGDLDGHRADRARGGVHQQRVALAHGQRVEGRLGRLSPRCQTAGHLPRHRGGFPRHVTGGDHDVLGVALQQREPEHLGPRRNPGHALPTWSTTPANSLPGMRGRPPVNPCGTQPARTAASNGCTPAVLTRTRTWPGPACGAGSSVTRSTSGPPGSAKAAARIISSFMRASRGPQARLRSSEVTGWNLCLTIRELFALLVLYLY